MRLSGRRRALDRPAAIREVLIVRSHMRMDASVLKAREAVVASRRRPVVLRHAARLVRKHRPEDTPLIVVEFVPHASRRQFGSLIHGQCEAIISELACLKLSC